MLDFGSGPGTASWVAAALWPGACTHLVGVEPSPQMRALADTLQANCAAPTDPGAAVPPPCRHVAALERLRGPEQQRRYDLVVAAYALGELPSRIAQQAAVRRLWAHTRDVLVIVEPGTPKAAAVVRAARQDVLDVAARAGRTRVKAAQRSLAASTDASPGGGEVGWSDDTDVHVVAPCAHEGRCPMADTSSWCHFVQRVQRTAAQRLSKGVANIWSHQDERFSYVILRRGARPTLPPRLLVAPGSSAPVPAEGGDASETAMAEAAALASAGWPRVVRPPRRRSRHVVLDLCTPAGELEQRTVAASHHAALGAGSAELLKSLRWGDSWPYSSVK
jgi:ribosomal protein RSM22 (predicted rRNA methylase)